MVEVHKEETYGAQVNTQWPEQDSQAFDGSRSWSEIVVHEARRYEARRYEPQRHEAPRREGRRRTRSVEGLASSIAVRTP